MTSSPHSMFENCLAVREVLQAYAPIVDGLPIHEGEAAMGRIEEQLRTTELAHALAEEHVTRLQEQLEARDDLLRDARSLLGYPDGGDEFSLACRAWLERFHAASIPARELISDLAETSETPIPASDPEAKLWESTLMDGLEDDPYPARKS